MTSVAVPGWKTAPRKEHLGPPAPLTFRKKAPTEQQKPSCYAVAAGGAANIKEIVGGLYGLSEETDILGIVGSSAGAAGGASIAFGLSFEDASGVVTDMLQDNRVLDFSPLAWPRYGLCKWDAIREVVKEVFGAKTTLGEAEIPFAVVVSDVYTRQPKVLSSWANPNVLLVECLPTSMAIPFLARAQTIPSAGTGNRLYCDGGVADNFALDVFADKPEPTIGICLHKQVDATPRRVNNLRDYVMAVAELALWESADVSSRDDDRVIALHTTDSGFDFNQTTEAIRAGIASGRKQVKDAVAMGILNHKDNA